MTGDEVRAPLVSIVLPTCERPAFLRIALASALEQSFDNFEIIVMNDGSPDSIASVRASFTDPRIRWMDNPVRLGMLRNNLRGFSLARGQLVINLHDDDAWATELLTTLVRPLLADATLVCAFSDHYVMDASGEVDAAATEGASMRWRRDRLRPGRHQPFWDIAVLDRSIPVQLATLFRRSEVDLTDVPPSVGPLYDLYLAFAMCRGGGAAWFEPSRLAFYRIHPGSQTAMNRLENAHAGIACYQLFAD
jgi:glycosyltransferase involved in cell wall biosynthesis